MLIITSSIDASCVGVKQNQWDGYLFAQHDVLALETGAWKVAFLQPSSGDHQHELVASASSPVTRALSILSSP